LAVLPIHDTRGKSRIVGGHFGASSSSLTSSASGEVLSMISYTGRWHSSQMYTPGPSNELLGKCFWLFRRTSTSGSTPPSTIRQWVLKRYFLLASFLMCRGNVSPDVPACSGGPTRQLTRIRGPGIHSIMVSSEIEKKYSPRASVTPQRPRIAYFGVFGSLRKPEGGRPTKPTCPTQKTGYHANGVGTGTAGTTLTCGHWNWRGITQAKRIP